jgi:hypothetical protein
VRKAIGLLGFVITLGGCPKTPPEPTKPAPSAAEDASVAAAVPSALDAGGGATAATGDAGGEHAGDAGAAVAALGWDLDPTDPARDYAMRYAKATKRYEDLFECVRFGKSVKDGAWSKVEVKENPSPKCKTGTAVRDVFLVDVAKDRLTVDDPKARAPLAAWPDESKPNEPATEVFSINAINEWKSPMANAFMLQRLSPIRIQLFGRATYLVITLSGWHAPLTRETDDGKLKEVMKKLCDANEGRSFAVTSAMELRTWFRANCAAGTYKWDKSPIYIPPP